MSVLAHKSLRMGERVCAPRWDTQQAVALHVCAQRLTAVLRSWRQGQNMMGAPSPLRPLRIEASGKLR